LHLAVARPRSSFINSVPPMHRSRRSSWSLTRIRVDRNAAEELVVGGDGGAQFKHACQRRILVTAVLECCGGGLVHILGVVAIGESLAEINGALLIDQRAHHGGDGGARGAEQDVVRPGVPRGGVGAHQGFRPGGSPRWSAPVADGNGLRAASFAERPDIGFWRFCPTGQPRFSPHRADGGDAGGRGGKVDLGPGHLVDEVGQGVQRDMGKALSARRGLFAG